MRKLDKKSKTTKVMVLMLGGTIAQLSSNSTDEFYNNKIDNLESFVGDFNLNKNIEVRFESYIQKISHEFNFAEIIVLVKKIEHLLNDFDGIVVTIGTNALEEIAYMTGLLVISPKPIIFTGAHLPQNSLAYDGKKNLYNALIVASSGIANQLGVLVTFNDHVVTARDATKWQPGLVHDFSLNGVGGVGHVIGGNFLLKCKPLYRHTHKSQFNIHGIETLPKVTIIYNHIGMDDLFINASIESGVSGIINAGFGKGYSARDISLSFKKAIEQGVIVVRCSRLGNSYTNVDLEYDNKYGFIVAKELSPHKAMILLSVSLLVTKDKKSLQKIFEEY